MLGVQASTLVYIFQSNARSYGDPRVPAMITCELGQARKGATAASDSCAGVSALGEPPILQYLCFILLLLLSIYSIYFIQYTG